MAISENIILGARNNASQAFREVGADAKKSMGDISKGAKDIFGSFTEMSSALNLVTGGLRMAADVGKKAFEWGKEGAAVTQTKESFDGLMERVGAMPGLLDELRAASLGTVDDLSLMSSTTTLLMGVSGDLAKALADASPELLTMAKAASKLNPELGDTEYMFRSLMGGIKRASPEVLDNLGITVRLEEAYKAYAESIGKTANELTSAEQKMALLNATLKAGDTLLQQVGGSAAAAGDSFAQWEAVTANQTNAIKAQWFKTVVPILQIMQELNLEVDRMSAWDPGNQPAAIQEQADATAHAAYTQRDWNVAIAESRPVVESLTGAQARNVAIYQMQELGIYDAMEAQDEYRDSVEEAEAAERGANQALQARIGKLNAMNDAYLRTAGAMQSLAEAEADHAKGVGEDIGRAVDDNIKKEGERYEAYKIIDDVMGTSLATQYDYNQAIEEAVKAFDPKNPEAFKEAIETIREDFKMLDEPLMQAQEKVDKLNNTFMAISGRHFTAYVDVIATLIKGGAGGGLGGGDDGSGWTGEKRHSGGPMWRGTPYLVQRNEVMVPASNGYMLTQAQAEQAVRGGGGGNTNITINAESAAAMAIAWMQVERARQQSVARSMGG